MAANVRVGEAHLLIQGDAPPPSAAKVRVGEVKVSFGEIVPPAVANVRVGEVKLSFGDVPIIATPANVRVGEASLRFGSAAVVPPQRTGLWTYRGGVIVPVVSQTYDSSGVLS